MLDFKVSAYTRKGWELDSLKFDIDSLQKWQFHCEALKLKFSNLRECSPKHVYIDLTKLLQTDSPLGPMEPLLTMTLEYKEKSSKVCVLLNGAFSLTDAQILPNLIEFNAKNFVDLAEETVTKFKKFLEK